MCHTKIARQSALTLIVVQEAIAVEVRAGHIQPLWSSVGKEGGMSYVEDLVQRKCDDVRGIYGQSNSFCKDAKHYLYALSNDSEDFRQDGFTIEAEFFRKAIRDEYKEVINMMLEQIAMIPDLSRVIILGVAVASNTYLEHYLRGCIEEIRDGADFRVEIVHSDIAAYGLPSWLRGTEC